jgi:hypothetical protein
MSISCSLPPSFPGGLGKTGRIQALKSYIPGEIIQTSPLQPQRKSARVEIGYFAYREMELNSTGNNELENITKANIFNTFDPQAGSIYIFHGPAVDIRAHHLQHDRIYDIHQSTYQASLRSYVFHQQHPSAGAGDSKDFVEP